MQECGEATEKLLKLREMPVVDDEAQAKRQALLEQQAQEAADELLAEEAQEKARQSKKKKKKKKKNAASAESTSEDKAPAGQADEVTASGTASAPKVPSGAKATPDEKERAPEGKGGKPKPKKEDTKASAQAADEEKLRQEQIKWVPPVTDPRRGMMGTWQSRSVTHSVGWDAVC